MKSIKKNYIISIFLLLFSTNIVAQIRPKSWEMGIYGGLVKTQVAAPDVFDTKGEYGMSAGVFAQQNITNRVFVKSALTYLKTSFKNGSAYPTDNEFSILQNNLSIGFVNGHLCVESGLLAQLLMRYKTLIPYASGKNPDGSLIYEFRKVTSLTPMKGITVNKANWGFNVGVGYNFKRIGMNLNYEYLFQPSYNYSEASYKLSYLKLGLTYKIKRL
jgi:hypothetical protein